MSKTSKTTVTNLAHLEHLSGDLKDSIDLYKQTGLTVAEIEKLLKQPEYKAIIPDYSFKNSKNKRETDAVEATVSFGRELGDLFEELSLKHSRIPTQQEFLDAQLPIMKAYWLDSKHKGATKGIEWTSAVEKACINRALRTYTSQLVEYHTITAMQELFPEWGIYSSSYLDLLLGVDLVVETGKKFMYVHIFKNSTHGFKAFYKKEKRGGRKINGKFKKFHRDFTGDKCLVFDYTPAHCSETTQFINGHPVFKQEFLKKQFLLFDKFNQIGTPIAKETKLKELNEFIGKIEIQEKVQDYYINEYKGGNK